MKFIRLIRYLLNFIRQCDIIYIGDIALWKKLDKDTNEIYWIGIRHDLRGNQIRTDKCKSALKAWEEVRTTKRKIKVVGVTKLKPLTYK